MLELALYSIRWHYFSGYFVWFCCVGQFKWASVQHTSFPSVFQLFSTTIVFSEWWCLWNCERLTLTKDTMTYFKSMEAIISNCAQENWYVMLLKGQWGSTKVRIHSVKTCSSVLGISIVALCSKDKHVYKGEEITDTCAPIFHIYINSLLF